MHYNKGGFVVCSVNGFCGMLRPALECFQAGRFCYKED